ncbi:Vesicle transport protein [Phlyctochytrium planicorne]|nr:Vesicle transport protein [Phlyctochytrium planicorne]
MGRKKDDDEGLRRKGLPVDDYMESDDPLPNGMPSSGLEYLRMVRQEAAKCAQVVVAPAPPPPKKKAEKKESSAVVNVRKHYFGKIANQRPPPLPTHLRASIEWIQEFLAEFTELRKVFAEKIVDKTKQKGINYKDILPKANDREGWRAFCYGVVPKNELSAIPVPADSDMNEAIEGMEEVSEEGEVTTAAPSFIKMDDVGAELNHQDPMPLLAITSAMDYVAAINVLQFHIGWLKNDDIKPLEVQWIFALLLRVETPLFSDHVAILRDLCRKCQRIRIKLLQNERLPGTKEEADCHPAVLGLRVIVTAITGYFGQKDLSDDLAERAETPDLNDEATSHTTPNFLTQDHSSQMAITDYFSSTQNDGMDDMCGGFKLTRTQRFYGFGICFGVGFLISILSSISLFFGNVAGFALLYTLGNVVSLLSTGFLVGFLKQFKKMFDSVRIVATLIFLVSMILTIVVAVLLQGPGGLMLVILCCVFQYLALFWYSASYIPFLQDLIKKCICGCVSK